MTAKELIAAAKAMPDTSETLREIIRLCDKPFIRDKQVCDLARALLRLREHPNAIHLPLLDQIVEEELNRGNQ